MVGIGASAGGIDALQLFVPQIPPESGLVYVVVQHLSPDHESVLAKVLARTSKIPVTEVAGETKIEANHIYVIPPNANLEISDGHLHVSRPDQQRGFRTPIDTFFMSLADVRKENAACVILSGTGSDGTLGLRAIKQEGGLTIAQDGAEYDGMMRSAVSTGLVDFVLPVEEIPGKIADYFRHLVDVGGKKGPDGVLTEAADSLMQICALLRARTGHDFSGYKDKTIARRVQRRMQVLQISEVPEFIQRLRKDPQEVDALLQDLLIGVTNFFRDKKSYEALEEQVIPEIFKGKGSDDNVRVWVAGCSQIEARLPEFPLTTPDPGRHRIAPASRPAGEQESIQGVAERQLLDRYSPAYVIIDADGEVLHASSRTGKYLELAAGAPKNDLFGMARRGLRPDLRAAVHKSASTGQVAIQPNITVGTNGGRQTVDLIVQPLRPRGTQDPLFMVIFQDVGGIESVEDSEKTETVEDVESANLRQLELELRATKERLQTMTEELESSNEELKSGNEELSSMNEELQSANEELETSKEELQSINEELQTVNAELNARVEELSRANSDIANLLESTQIATVFLDRNLAVKSFTPAAKDVFRLVESDTGRPITHVRARFDSDTVQEDAERVMRTLSTIERQVKSNYNDARYVMRMLPYRTVDNVIAGVVITFMDVTQIAAAERKVIELTQSLGLQLDTLETVLDIVPIGMLLLEDGTKHEVRANQQSRRLLGENSGGKRFQTLSSAPRIFVDGRELRSDENPLQRAASAGGDVIRDFMCEIERATGDRISVRISAFPIFSEDRKVRGAVATLSPQ